MNFIIDTIIGFVDTLFVSKLGLTEVATVGVANAVLAVYIAIFMVIGVGTSSLIARHIGAGNTKSPMYSAAIGMWVIRVIGVYVLGIQFK